MADEDAGKPRVYVETTVVSYLIARPSGNLRIAAHQVATKEWWQISKHSCNLVTSELVLLEAGAGDPSASKERINVLAPLPLLRTSEEVDRLSEQLIHCKLIPAGVADDATHVAMAAVHQVDFLATWNMKHIANPYLRDRISSLIAGEGFIPPVICTPEDLLEGERHDRPDR